ncbi:MAG: tyrosine-type recombinase/integrase, partial [Bacillales bacterium]|nr:tyrosine-type recombinase/integrase [Bacillales bacterium]
KILIAELKIYVLGVKKLRIQAADIWKQAFDLEGNKITFLFSNTMGKPNHNISIQESWKRFINYKTNLPYLNFHGLRHTCATLLIQNGANINAVKELLGHADIGMTINQYTHMGIDDIEKALERFDEIL